MMGQHLDFKLYTRGNLSLLRTDAVPSRDSPVPLSSIPVWPQHKVGDGSLTSANHPGGTWMPLEGVWHTLLLLPIPFAHPALVASQSPWSFFFFIYPVMLHTYIHLFSVK